MVFDVSQPIGGGYKLLTVKCDDETRRLSVEIITANLLLVHSLDDVPEDLYWESSTGGVIEVSPYVQKGEFLIIFSNGPLDRGWVFIDDERYIKNPWGAAKYVRMVRLLQ